MLERFDGYWGPKEPWARVVRKELPNDAARVAQLKAGQVDLIVRAPASDVPTLKRDPKLSVATIETVYVFNMELDMRDKSLADQRQGWLAAAEEPAAGSEGARGDRPRHRPAGAARRSPMEELGAPANQLVTDSIAGFNKSLPPREARRQQGQGAAGRGRLSERLQDHLLLHQ